MAQGWGLGCKRVRLSGNLTITPKGRIINSYLLTTQIVYIHIMGTVISHRLTLGWLSAFYCLFNPASFCSQYHWRLYTISSINHIISHQAVILVQSSSSSPVSRWRWLNPLSHSATTNRTTQTSLETVNHFARPCTIIWPVFDNFWLCKILHLSPKFLSTRTFQKSFYRVLGSWIYIF